MFENVVVGFGNHEHATHALRWGAEVATTAGLPLHVVNVFDPTYSEIAPDWYQDLLEDRRRLIHEVLAEAGCAGADIVVLQGHDASHELAGYLEGVDGALGVVGAQDTSTLGGLGSTHVPHSILHRTRTPLAVLRPEHEPVFGGTVVLGVDGSEANLPAVRFAEDFARATKASLLAVFAYDPGDDTHPHPPRWTHRDEPDVREALDRVRAVPVDLTIEAGHPADLLLTEARSLRASATVCGTRGRGELGGLALGRVPSHLLTFAHGPVIVVPHR